MKYTDMYGLDDRIIEFLKSFRTSYEGPSATDLSKISVTTLLQPPHLRYLRAKHYDNIVRDYRDDQDVILGTLVHSVFEKLAEASKAKGNDLLRVEERLEVPITKNTTISGQFDELEILSIEKNTGILTDIKTITVHGIRNKEKLNSYFKQANIYRWLIKKVLGTDIEKAELFCVLKSWRRTEFDKMSDYPKTMFERIDVPIAPLEDVEKYILHRVKLHEEATKGLTEACDPVDRWSDTIKYAAMVEGFKRSKGNFATPEEAQKKVDEFIKEGKKAYVEERKPSRVDARCKQWCDVSPFCPYAQSMKYKNEAFEHYTNGGG